MKSEIGILLLAYVLTGVVRANSYTNLAGNALVGFPASLTSKTVTLTNGAEKAASCRPSRRC